MSIRSYTQLMEQASNWQAQTTVTPQGNSVSYAFWNMAQPAQGHVLIIPGRNERFLKYTEVAGEWAARGIQTLCVSPNPDVSNFTRYMDEFQHVFNSIWLPHVKNDFAIVQGHSTGAHIAARALSTGQSHIKGAEALIMSAPLAGMNYRVPHIPDSVAAAVTSIMGTLMPNAYALGQKAYDRSLWQFEGNRWTSDEGRYGMMMDIAEHAPQHAPHGAKWGWVLAAQRSCAAFDRDLPKLKIPQLLLATPNDRAVNGDAQGKFKLAERVDFPESGHEIFMERDEIRAKAWQHIDRFVAQLRHNRAPHAA
mgnify:CR=1 FL=1